MENGGRCYGATLDAPSPYRMAGTAGAAAGCYGRDVIDQLDPKERARLDRERAEIQAEDGEWDCGACGATWGPSSDFVWHWPAEDCRAVRPPRPAAR